MPGIVDLPQVGQEATREFADLFSCEPQRRHFGEYLTGLMIAERKSVSGINREFAVTTDQSRLNPFLTVASCVCNVELSVTSPVTRIVKGERAARH